MKQLSAQLRRLAQLAWKSGLRGRSLEKSALLHPVDEVFAKLRHPTGQVDREALKAAAVQDIFDHLSRIADERYKPGRKKWEATVEFVDLWFDNILDGVYQGNLRKLLADEKLIRSAYHFYIREQIPRRRAKEGPEEAAELLDTDEE